MTALRRARRAVVEEGGAGGGGGQDCPSKVPTAITAEGEPKPLGTGPQARRGLSDRKRRVSCVIPEAQAEGTVEVRALYLYSETYV